MKTLAIAFAHSGDLCAASRADEVVANHYQIFDSPAPQFAPIKVWDDGKFVYIQLKAPYNGEIPTVLAGRQPGKFALVDARWDQKTSQFVVSELVDRLVLRLDDKYVEINRS